MTHHKISHTLSPSSLWQGMIGALFIPFLALGACAKMGTPSPAVLTSLVDITAGEQHTCALTSSGAVKCWGLNHDGQLGDGTRVDKKTPADVMGLTSGVKTVAAGERHTCAVTHDGAVKCWGDNEYGQLGDGTGSDSSIPIVVSGQTSGLKAVAVGGRHTCALNDAGGVRCWGFNHDGQLGDGTRNDRSLPGDVVGVTSGAKAISAGGQHTCALTLKYAVCWGDNEDGQLGDGTTTDTLAAKPEGGD
jgi:hypothetical protein